MNGVKFKIIENDSISLTYEKNSINFGEIANYLSQNDIQYLILSQKMGI